MSQFYSIAKYILYFVIAAFIIVIYNVFVNSSVVPAGSSIPSSDIRSDYFSAIVTSTFIFSFIPIMARKKSHVQVLAALWLVKVMVTIGLMLLYEYRYILDAYVYFENAKNGIGYDYHVGYGKGTENITFLTSIFMALTNDSYHAVKIIYSFIGFLGIWFFYKGVSIYSGKDNIGFFVLLSLVPSLLFWSSILGKDPIVLFGVGLYFWGISGMLHSRGVKYLFFIAAGLILASFIRQWYAVIMAMPLLFMFMVGRSLLQRVLLSIIAGLLLYYAIHVFLESFDVVDASSLSERLAQYSTIGSGGAARAVNVSNLSSFVFFLPFGIFTALFRPFPGEVMNAFGIISGIENIIIFGFFIGMALRFKFRYFHQPYILFLVTFIVTWGVIYGLVSSQNLGTAVRYKLQVLPFLIVLIYIIKSQKYRA